MAKFRDLIVFQKADELAFSIYKATEPFPRSEMFGLTSQMRRAALSIPTNIVEGYARKSKKELSQFINISLGSLAETEYLLDFSKQIQPKLRTFLQKSAGFYGASTVLFDFCLPGRCLRSSALMPSALF